METTMYEIISSISYPFVAALGVIGVAVVYFLGPDGHTDSDGIEGSNNDKAIKVGVFYIFLTAFWARFIH